MYDGSFVIFFFKLNYNDNLKGYESLFDRQKSTCFGFRIYFTKVKYVKVSPFQNEYA